MRIIPQARSKVIEPIISALDDIKVAVYLLVMNLIISRIRVRGLEGWSSSQPRWRPWSVLRDAALRVAPLERDIARVADSHHARERGHPEPQRRTAPEGSLRWIRDARSRQALDPRVRGDDTMAQDVGSIERDGRRLGSYPDDLRADLDQLFLERRQRQSLIGSGAASMRRKFRTAVRHKRIGSV
jgi:hypothetical protein